MVARMNDAEAIMWAVESDPVLRSDFMNITLVDRPPDRVRLRAGIERAIGLYPPLRQRVVRPPLGLAPPVWADDPDFDLDYHVRHVAVPLPGTHRQLLDLAATLAGPPIDRARPLWELTVVEGLEGGRAAVLQRLHHSLTDGVGGMKLLRTVLDRTAEGSAPVSTPNPQVWRHPEIFYPTEQISGPMASWLAPGDPEWPPERGANPLGDVASALAYRLGQGVAAARKGLEVAAQLRSLSSEELKAIADQAGRTARSVADQMVVSGGALSPVMVGRSLARRFETYTLDLSSVRRAAKALGGTRNALFVAGVTGALHAYHEQMGAPCPALRMAVPLTLRAGSGPLGGNHFAPARVVVPLGPKDPAQRLSVTRAVLDALSAEPGIGMTESVAGLVSLLPPPLLALALRAQVRTVDFATSIVPGLRSEQFLAGARVEASWPVGPRLGCAVNLTLLSCQNRLDLGVNLDPAAVTDQTAFMEALQESFSTLLEVA